MVVEYGITLDRVWLPLSLIRRLEGHGPWNAPFTKVTADQERVLISSCARPRISPRPHAKSRPRQVERPKVLVGLVLEERGNGGLDLAAHRVDVVPRPHRGGLAVHGVLAGNVPGPGGQPVGQHLDRGDRLRRGERAVPGAVHKHLREQAAAADPVHGAALGLLVLGHDQTQ
jgi:hypothetical protein